MQSKACRDTSYNCKKTMLDSGMVSSEVIYNSLAEPGSKSQPSEPSPPGLNEFDGLYHNSDGTRSFPDGQIVEGVNDWILKSGENFKGSPITEQMLK